MIKYITGLFSILMLLFVQPVHAAGPPEPSVFSNPLAITFISLMLLLLIIIGILANILIGAADVKLRKRKATGIGSSATALLLLLFMLLAPSLFAQDAGTTATSTKAASTIGGMAASTFYIMVTILFLELLVIIAMLINIKLLLRKEVEKTQAETVVKSVEVIKEEKANKLSWWDRFNKFRPVSQEAELDLGHDYDGIRELNNRLPPWWLYGFYATILFAAIYLWRFHVSHNGPSSRQEYERSVARAEIKIKKYLEAKGEIVDENTVALLTSASDLEAGKAIFLDPSKCPACHNVDGGGNAVGPNLTDDYWLYGGSIRDIFKTIKYGTSKGMRSWKDDLSARQMAQVASYIRTLKGTKPANPKEPQGELYKEETVSKPAADSAATAGPK